MKVKLSFIIWILFSINSTPILAQLDTSLTREQMHQDFEQLIQIIQDVNPQIKVRKEVTGVDNIELIKKMKDAIDSISSYYYYINFLNKALNNLFDIHASMTNSFSSDYDNLIGIDTSVIKTIKKEYVEWRNDNTHRLKWFPCNPTYLDGEYYLHGRYYFVRKISPYDTVMLTNPKIISYRERPYFDYIKKNISRYMNGSVRWDYKNKNYYCLKSAFENNGNICLKEADDSTVSFNLSNYNILVSGISSMDITNEFRQSDDSLKRRNGKRVHYFSNKKTLYIYLDKMMDNNDSIKSKILSISKGKVIHKIVIDVRGNTGGSDRYWIDILKILIADSVPYKSKLAFNNSNRVINHFENKKLFLNSVDSVSFNWLAQPNSFLLTKDKEYYIIPDSNSIRFSGKIYVLQNENVFSAGHSITSYCNQINQLVSVGSPTGLLAGFGINPFIFQLSNSKFTFRLEPAIDVTNVKTAEDVYHDIPEILIETPLSESFKELDYKWRDQKSMEYLSNIDYLMQFIFELE